MGGHNPRHFLAMSCNQHILTLLDQIKQMTKPILGFKSPKFRHLVTPA